MADFSHVDVEVLDVDYEPHVPKRYGLKLATATTVLYRDEVKTHRIEGSVAEKAAAVLQLDDRVESLEFEPMTISYRADGKTRTYTPDALVRCQGNNRTLYEFKSEQYLSRKWEDVNRNCSAGEQAGIQYGWGMRLITEKDLEPFSALATFLVDYRFDEIIKLTELRCSIMCTAKGTSVRE